MVSSGLLKALFPRVCFVRYGRSTHWPPKKPRSYKRRLYDAALAPMIAPTTKICPSFREKREQFLQAKNAYTEYDLGMIRCIREDIISQGYDVLAICQRLSASRRDEWLTANQLRLQGLEFSKHNNRLIRKVLEGTPLQTLYSVLVGINCQLLGKGIDAVVAVIKACEKVEWIIPLAIVYGSRILSVNEAKDLCKYSLVEDHRAETVQLLSSAPTELVSLLTHPLNDLIMTLEQIQRRNVKS